MNSEDRKHIVTLLGNWEEEFPVYTWSVEDVDVWPIIKMRIFFEKVKEVRGNEYRPTKINLAKLIHEVFRFIFLKKSAVIFAGSKHHRIKFMNSSVNRYYLPLVEYLKSKKISFLQSEYLSDDEAGPQVIKLDRLIRLTYRPGLLSKIKKNDLWNDPTYRKFLSDVHTKLSIHPIKVQGLVINSIFSVKRWSFVYNALFYITRPKLVIGLWYYSNAQFGMILAAKKRGIYSVDLQHGAQGFLHPAYTFGKFPTNGLNTLPNGFWCWDEESAKHLERWFKTSIKSIEVCGNPWVTYLSNWTGYGTNLLHEINKKIIIYTHQPVQESIDPYLIEAIELTAGDFFWWIRLHPGTTEKEKIRIVELIESRNLTNKVKLEIKSELPLPIILKFAHLHVSKYSGSIVEAALIGTVSIILEDTGCNTFKELINTNQAYGLLDPSTDKIISFIKNHKGNKELKQVDYKDVLDRYI